MSGEKMNIDPGALCERLGTIYPDIGACGIDVSMEFDETAGRWAVILEKKGHRLKTFLEPEDIKACQEGRQCVALGIQIGELKKNVGLL